MICSLRCAIISPNCSAPGVVVGVLCASYNQLTVCLGHHRSTALLATCEEARLIPSFIDRIEYRQVALTRNTKYVLGAVCE